jgi:tryptophanase
MSAKKDGLVNIGGLFLLAIKTSLLKPIKLAIVHEGFITYGGLAGRDMDALGCRYKRGL